MMGINEATMRRLAFIRYMWRRANEDCGRPEPMSAAAVLTFHGAVALFLHPTSEHVYSGSANPAFLEYLELIGKKITDGLTGKESMRRLNKARVALKHHGTMPSQLDIKEFQLSVREFFTVN